MADHGGPDRAPPTFRPVVVTFHGSDVGENLSGDAENHFTLRSVLLATSARAAEGVVVVAAASGGCSGRHAKAGKSRDSLWHDLERFKPRTTRLQAQVGLGTRLLSTCCLHPATAIRLKRPWLAKAAVEKWRRQAPDGASYLSSIPNEEVPVWLNAACLAAASMHEGLPTVVKEGWRAAFRVSVDVG